VIRGIFADVFLVLAVATVLASAVGVLVMRGVYAKLHFVTPAALVAPVLVTLAVLMKAGFSAATAEVLLALLFLVIAGPYLSHATIRAARVREQGDWRPGKGRPGGGQPAGDGRPGGGQPAGDGRPGGGQPAGEGRPGGGQA
jgi:multisubunit Na+/H+ antiporter MnhG subunit